SATSQMPFSFSSIRLSVPDSGPRRLAQRRELRELRIELPVRVGLLEPMALDLAAGRLRDALDRDDLRHLESGLFVDEPCDRLRGGEQIRNRAPVQHEDHQLLDFRLAGANPGGDYLAELEPGNALHDRLEIVRVGVLAIDEDDLLRSTGDIELPAVHEPQVA